MGEQLTGTIFDAMIQWLYTTVFSAISAFFEKMGNMGAEIFELSWIQAILRLFRLLGWLLFVCGIVIAVFDLAIEYNSGARTNLKGTALNAMKGFAAASLIGVLPIELYKFCVSLQATFTDDLAVLFGGEQNVSIGQVASYVLTGKFQITDLGSGALMMLLTLIAFAYCVVKIFFANIKRGGLLLVQIAVGSLYLFSVPRGYTDGFNQWCRQVIALCLTAFLQTTLLYLGLMTFTQNPLLGLGIMLAAGDVPRIAQQFGLDSSVRVNMASAFYATNTAINLSRVVHAAR